MVPIPLAHRGWWWPEPRRQNTPPAFLAAARAGYGLELDVRFTAPSAGQGAPQAPPARICIAHGRDGPAWPAEDILPALCSAPALAWNLKDLQAPPGLAEFLEKHGLRDKSVVFDQELLAGMGIERRLLDRRLAELGLPHLARASGHHEGDGLALALVHPTAAGVWLDCNGTDWVTPTVLAACRGAGKASYVVSPELHGRPLDLALWVAWQAADGICTDFPHLLAAWDAGAPLEPVDPWWAP